MIYKRGKKGIYWYGFMWQGRLIRESTKQTNDKVARNQESAHRTKLSNAEVGIREPKILPTLKEFCATRFEPWAKSTFENTTRKSWLWYRTGIRALTNYRPLADAALDQITGELASEFAAHRLREGVQITTLNNDLRVLRRALRVAAEWGTLEAAPKIKLFPGSRHRERVVTPEEEGRYLAVASEPLASIAAILADTGMRPDECFRLRWEAITWLNGHHGALLVTRGKTAAARRVIPMTPRARSVLETLWERAGRPGEGWIWSAQTRSGHIEPSGLRKRHAKAMEVSKVRPFVLYSLRHTFLTRLGESGCDAWTLARIAGHASIAISTRYVHPSEDAVLAAVERLGGHKIGHSQVEALQLPVATETASIVH